MNKEKPKLYRKVNTKTHRVHHHFGGDFRHSRHQKKEDSITSGKMPKEQRGLDYTPLFKFLLSKVGKKWDAVFSEAKSRLDKEDPIFWLVALSEEEKQDFVRVGESTYCSGLFVDENGVLQKCNPDLKASEMTPFCGCCTHTFNGEVFGKKYEE